MHVPLSVFFVLFVCTYVLRCYHRVSTQLQLNVYDQEEVKHLTVKNYLIIFNCNHLIEIYVRLKLRIFYWFM
jgi:hypothetical protein